MDEMTKQEAIEILKKSVMFTDESARLQTEAYTLAIKALEKEIDDETDRHMGDFDYCSDGRREP